MFFDFQDGHPDIERLPRAMTVREGVLVAIIIHLLAVIAVLVVPELPWVKAAIEAAEARRLAAAEAVVARQREERPFIFVQPRVDLEALRPPPRAPLSDIDREAMTYERPPDPQNAQPFSRGNTRQFDEAVPPAAPPPLGSPTPVPPQASAPGGGVRSEQPLTPGEGYILPDRGTNGRGRDGASAPPPVPPGTPTGLASSLRNLQQYLDRTRGQFDNPTGGGQYGSSFQFDTKGVDFGAWLARFRIQVMRNWMIPQAAYFLKGHVGITLNIARNGRISDITIVDPSSVQGFNHAAFNALAASNPTVPLPEAYPDEILRMRVIFFYNEEPPAPTP